MKIVLNEKAQNNCVLEIYNRVMVEKYTADTLTAQKPDLTSNEFIPVIQIHGNMGVKPKKCNPKFII